MQDFFCCGKASVSVIFFLLAEILVVFFFCYLSPNFSLLYGEEVDGRLFKIDCRRESAICCHSLLVDDTAPTLSTFNHKFLLSSPIAGV